MNFIPSLAEARRGVVRVNVGTLPLYFVTAYEPAHEVLVGQGRFFNKGKMFQETKALVGDGLATSDGDLHRRQRRMMQPPFHNQKIAGYADIMSRRAGALADSWQHGQTIRVDQALYGLSLGVVVEALFSAELAQPVIAEVQRSLPVVMTLIPVRAFLPSMFVTLPLPMNRRFDRAVSRLREAVDFATARLRESRSEGTDLLSVMLSARDPDTGEGMSAEQVRNEIITILLAGTDTTATTLSWACHEIARHPDVERKLHAEIDEVVGGKEVGIEDVPRLRYTSQVLSEVVRLHTTLVIMRNATAEVEVGGHRIPAGAELLVCPYVIHRDPRFFPDPAVFDPDRWLPDRAKRVPHGAFLPFGLGKRKCIGENFSWTEMVIALATISSHWRLSPAPGHTVREVVAAIPRVNALPMIAEAR
jgi:cytochrome P450